MTQCLAHSRKVEHAVHTHPAVRECTVRIRALRQVFADTHQSRMRDSSRDTCIVLSI